MADEQVLHPAPASGRARELWLQNAAGHILFRDVRGHARAQIDAGLSPEADRAAKKAIDDAVYGLMMLLDGVTGGLRSVRRDRDGDESVTLRMTVELIRDGESVVKLNLADSDGMCMGYHSWLAGDFGEDPIVEP